MSFADGMKKRRKLLHMTQKELCKRSTVPQSTISAIENGTRSPTEETMVMIAKGLMCTVGELLGETSQEDPGSDLDQQLLNLMMALPDSDCQRMMDFAAGLIASRKGQSSPDQSRGQ